MYVINAYAVLAGSLLFLLSWTLPYQSSDHFKQKAAVSPTLIKSLKQIFFVNYNLSENTLTVDQIPSLYLIWKYQHLFNISHYFTMAGEQTLWIAAQEEETKLCKQFQPHPVSSHHSFVEYDVMLESTFSFDVIQFPWKTKEVWEQQLFP